MRGENYPGKPLTYESVKVFDENGNFVEALSNVFMENVHGKEGWTAQTVIHPKHCYPAALRKTIKREYTYTNEGAFWMVNGSHAM